MTARGRQLGLLLLAAASVAIPSPATRSEVLDLHKYFVNQTIMLQQFPCSKRELECFNKTQLLYDGDGQCYSVGERGPCAEGELFHADRAEASRKGGHLRGTCSNACGDLARNPVAATGQCLTKAEVEAKICQEELYLRSALDVFGEWVCEWTQLPCKTQPRGIPYSGQYDFLDYNGLCYVPNVYRNWISDEQNITECNKETSDHPVLRYFTNKTYLEREYPCTQEEKRCLRYGRVLHSDGNCHVPGQWNNVCEPGKIFHIDWEEANKGDGRLVGTCKSSCTDFQQPVVATGECEDSNTLVHGMCRWERGMITQQDEFGHMACSCAMTAPPMAPPPSLPPPASAPGHCRAPDFSNPVRSPSYDQTLTLGFRLPCSEEEHACLREGCVLAGGGCHALRTRGPCAEGEELVLDKEALAHARLRAVCKICRCPEGRVKMPIGGECFTHEQMARILCPDQQVALDEFGGWQCHYEAEFPADLTRTVRDAATGECELPEKFASYTDNPIVGTVASSTDSDILTNSTPEDGYEGNNTVY